MQKVYKLYRGDIGKLTQPSIPIRYILTSSAWPVVFVIHTVVVVVVSHIQRIGCQPEKNYFTRWPIPLVVC